MTLNEARNIIGNQQIAHLKNMIKALSMFPFLNTKEDEIRLQAAKLIIKAHNKNLKSSILRGARLG